MEIWFIAPIIISIIIVVGIWVMLKIKNDDDESSRSVGESTTVSSSASVPVTAVEDPAVSAADAMVWHSYSNVWTNDQCPNLGNYSDIMSSADCQAKCVATDSCTAVNYDPVEKWCILRKCETGVQPTGTVGSYVGYARY
jgi:hypothetical protein